MNKDPCVHDRLGRLQYTVHMSGAHSYSTTCSKCGAQTVMGWGKPQPPSKPIIFSDDFMQRLRAAGERGLWFPW